MNLLNITVTCFLHCSSPVKLKSSQSRSSNKWDLLQCLDELIPPNDVKTNVESNVDFVVVDGAVLVNMLKPAATSQTFHDYVIQFMAYIQRQFTATVRRVDVVFDQYRIDSPKAEARKKRGKGIRIRVDGTKKIPGNWQQFLREDGSKTELFRLISQQVAKQQCKFPGLVIITDGEDVN